MSLIKLTKNLENFQWTDYSKAGEGRSPQQDGTDYFERPNPQSLEQMESKFGKLDTQPPVRGPYGVSNMMDGEKQGRGFIPPGSTPEGFIKDMNLQHNKSELEIGGDLTRTPLSYDIAGVTSTLSYGEVTKKELNIEPQAKGAYGTKVLPISTYTSRQPIEDIPFGEVGGSNTYYGNLEPLSSRTSQFQKEDGSYTTPKEPSFESEKTQQRSFVIPAPYPRNDLAFSIDGQILSNWSSPLLKSSGYGIDSEVDLGIYNSFPTPVSPSELELKFITTQTKSNGIWPYKILGFEGDHPLIRKDIGQRYQIGNMENWMAVQVARTGDDVSRIEKWLETPKGGLWITKQQILQELNPREETRFWSEPNLLLSVPPLFHAKRHQGENYIDTADFGPLFEGDPPQGGLSLRSMIEGKFPKLTGPLKTMDEGMDKITAGLDAVGSALGIIDFNKIGAGGRLRFLRDRFIALDGPADATLLGFNMTQGLNNTSPFGRTPKIPTQYVFSQKGAFGRGSIHENLGGGLGQSDAGVSLIHKYKSLSYGELGGKYVPHKSPLPSHGRKITADMPRLSDYPAFAPEPGKEINNEAWEEASKAIEPTIRAFNKDLTEIDNLNKSVESYKKDLEKYGTINDQIGDPGMNVSSLGLVTDTTTDGSGLGVIKKNVGQTSKPGENYKSLATDKINMLPYGQDYKDPNDGSVNDFIKFKFYDIQNKKHIIFRAILSGISDSITPEWNGTRYIGRPDQVYVYAGAERKLSFDFSIYPKTKQEFPVLLEKMNYLVGLCYPTFTEKNRMIAPFIELTLGDMFNRTPGFLDSLSVTVDDVSTWEIEDGLQFPKHITCNCSFTYVGKYLPSSLGKHYELPWLDDKGWGVSEDGQTKLRGTFEGENLDPTRNAKGDYNMEKLFGTLERKTANGDT